MKPGGMDIELNGSTYAATTGGYESAIPSESVYELEEASYFTRARRGSFSAEEVEVANIFSDPFCARQPQFVVQFGRSDRANEYPTYQALGSGVDSLSNAEENIRDLSYEIDSNLGVAEEYSTHRPFLKAHTTLNDSSVLYVEIYYHTLEADSVKHCEIILFHPNQPFGTDRYDGIFERAPVGIPYYTEQAEISRKTDFRFIGYEPERVQRTEALRHSAIDIGSIENPLPVHGISLDEPWAGFNTPKEFFPELYCPSDEFDGARITSTRAVELDIIEPVFYKMEVDS